MPTKEELNRQLWEAAYNGHTEEVIKLLKDGAEIDSQDSPSWTGLRYNDGNTPIHYAIQKGHFEIVKLLLEKGADSNIKNNADRTPLLSAINRCYPKIAQELLKHGANAGIADKDGVTPLLSAVINFRSLGFKELVEELLQRTDVDVNWKTRKGVTALSHTISNYSKPIYKELLAVLLQHKDMEVSTKDGEKVLHRAVANNQIDVVRALLNAGADPTIENQAGQTLLDLATDKDNSEVIEVLKKAIAEREEQQNKELLEKSSFDKLDVFEQLADIRITAVNQNSRKNVNLLS